MDKWGKSVNAKTFKINKMLTKTSNLVTKHHPLLKLETRNFFWCPIKMKQFELGKKKTKNAEFWNFLSIFVLRYFTIEDSDNLIFLLVFSKRKASLSTRILKRSFIRWTKSLTRSTLHSQLLLFLLLFLYKKMMARLKDDTYFARKSCKTKNAR